MQAYSDLFDVKLGWACSAWVKPRICLVYGSRILPSEADCHVKFLFHIGHPRMKKHQPLRPIRDDQAGVSACLGRLQRSRCSAAGRRHRLKSALGPSWSSSNARDGRCCLDTQAAVRGTGTIAAAASMR